MAFLQSATFMGGYMVIVSEFLSLFHALTTLWLALFWGLALVAAIIIGWKKGWFNEGFNSLKAEWKKPDWFDILAGTILAIILVLLFFIALKSPANNNDSLFYHMSRVMHWAQNRGLQHYATAYIWQLTFPISAELPILHFRLLWGNDQFANLVQFTSMLGSIIGISAITALLRGGHKIQWLAVAFCISIPMGILQATSTQNDYVTAFWLTSLTYFTVTAVKRETGWLEIVTYGLCLGMGMQTKGTFFPFAFPLIIWFVIGRLLYRPFRQIMQYGIIISLFVLAINLGYWSRNFISYGGIFGPREFVTARTSQSLGVGLLTGAIIRNAAIHFATPSDDLNNDMIKGLKKYLENMDPNMKNVKLTWAWNHEDFAGNPLHLSLIIAAFVFLLINYKRIKDSTVFGYAAAIAGMFIFFSLIIGYDDFIIRLELPWFVVSSPLIAIAVSLLNDKWLPNVLTILLLLAAFPWVLFNRTRPLIAMRPSNDPFTIPCLAGCTTGSILNEPPEKTMFAVWGSLGSAYVDAMKQVKQTGCQDIGLKLDSNDLEYAYWWLLGAPQNGMRLESIVTYPELERYLDPNFKPCVIICTTCGDQPQLFGLERIGSYGDGRIKIYSGGIYDPTQQ